MNVFFFFFHEEVKITLAIFVSVQFLSLWISKPILQIKIFCCIGTSNMLFLKSVQNTDKNELVSGIKVSLHRVKTSHFNFSGGAYSTTEM